MRSTHSCISRWSRLPARHALRSTSDVHRDRGSLCKLSVSGLPQAASEHSLSQSTAFIHGLLKLHFCISTLYMYYYLIIDVFN